jgi:hypothetical protein
VLDITRITQVLQQAGRLEADQVAALLPGAHHP